MHFKQLLMLYFYCCYWFRREMKSDLIAHICKWLIVNTFVQHAYTVSHGISNRIFVIESNNLFSFPSKQFNYIRKLLLRIDKFSINWCNLKVILLKQLRLFLCRDVFIWSICKTILELWLRVWRIESETKM